jgi:1-acyl-sn-glycerol-3-phosphate acyltransferase
MPHQEPALRYFLPGNKVGLPDFNSYLSTLIKAGYGIGAPYLLIKLLASLSIETTLDPVIRYFARYLRRQLQIKLEVAGLTRIDKSLTYIITPLHEGFADALALAEVPLQMKFVARDELFREWPVLGTFLRETDQLEVCPEKGISGYRSLLKEAKAVIERGESLVIFPQGSILGIETDFSAGAFGLAQHYRLPVLPIAITGSHRVWDYPFSKRLRFGQRISMRVLPPIFPNHPAYSSRESLRVYTRNILKKAALRGDMASPRHFNPEIDGYWDGYAYEIDPEFPELFFKIATYRGKTTLNELKTRPEISD